MIKRELFKRLKFRHTNKWYLNKVESFLEKETPKILWDFEIQTNQPISARRPDQVLITKKKKKKLDFSDLADKRVKKIKESETRNLYMDLAR